MGSLHDRALAGLRQALLARADALLETLDTVFEERSLRAALQARRQLAELRAAARFVRAASLQRDCIELQHQLLALGRHLAPGVSEQQSRPLVRLALQIRRHAGALALPVPWPGQSPGALRAAQLAPDLPAVLLRHVRGSLNRYAELGTAGEGLSWQALRGAAQLADVLPGSVLLASGELQALLRWEQYLLTSGQSPSGRLLQHLAMRLLTLCEEAGATAALRQSLESQQGPLAERTLHLLQQAVVLLPDFAPSGPTLMRTLQQALRAMRLLRLSQSVPLLTATGLPAVVQPVLLRMLLRLQDDMARAASGNPVPCAGLPPAALEASLRASLRRQRPEAAAQLLETCLGSEGALAPSTAPAMQGLVQQERAIALQSLQQWLQESAQRSGPPALSDAADLAVTRLTQQALLTGDLALYELLVLLGQCFTRSRELQRDARDWRAVLAAVLPFVEEAGRRWQRQRVLRRLLMLEARLRVLSSATAAGVALSLASGLRHLPRLCVAAFLQQEAIPSAFSAHNRQLLMELRILASGARALQVQRIAALSAALAQVHEALAQVSVLPSRFLHDTGGTGLLTQGHAALCRGLNQAAARQETSASPALLGALYDWLACHGEQAAGRAGFVREAQALMRQILRAGSDPQRLHALHTLKGNAALYRCEPVVQLCHRAERSLLRTARRRPTAGGPADHSVCEPAAVSPLLAQLQQAVARLVAGDSAVAVSAVPLCVGTGPVRDHASTPAPHDLPYCRGLSTRLRTGLQSLHDVLQAADATPARAHHALALELVREQLAQATQLEEDLLASPRVYLARLAPRLRRVLEDAANRQGKSACLEIRDDGRCVDRSMLERLVAPLEHLLRNAVVHGIEPPAQRRARGKPECGRVRVSLRSSRAMLQLCVEDDGQGLGAPQSLFEPGHSTRLIADADAGHGLGLAAVQADVEALGGSVAVTSTPGQGTCFWLQMPENSGLGDIHAMPL